eukprot:gene3987-4956_t
MTTTTTTTIVSLACDARDLLLEAGAAAADVLAPTITLLGGSWLRVVYGVPAAVGLAACESYAGSDAGDCYAVAWDDVDGDVTMALQLRSNGSSTRRHCLPGTVTLGECFPSTYSYEYSVSDQDGSWGKVDPGGASMRILFSPLYRMSVVLLAGNTAVLPIVVELVERADVAASVHLHANANTSTGAALEAARLIDPSSGEAVAFRSAVAAMLNDHAAASSAAGSLPAAAGDINVTASSVEAPEGRNSGVYYLEVNFTVAVVVVGGSSGSEEIQTQLEQRSSQVIEAIISASSCNATNSTAPVPASLDAYLTAAASAEGVSLASTVLGLSAPITSTPVSREVDTGSANHAALRAEISEVSDSLEATTETAAVVETLTSEGTAWVEEAPQEVQASWTWATRLDSDSGHVEALAESMAVLSPPGQSNDKLSTIGADLALSTNLAEAVAERAADALEGAILGSASREAQPPPPATSPQQAGVDGVGGANGASDSSFSASELTGSGLERYIEEEVVAGLVLSVWRGTVETNASACRTRFLGVQLGHRGDQCFHSAGSTEPYGIDPVFNRRSQLYSPWLEGREGEFYNLSSHGEVLDSGKRVMRPFTSVPSAGLGRNGFSLVVSRQLSGDRAGSLVSLVSDGHLLDDATARVRMQLVTYNPEGSFYTNSKVEFTRNAGGFYRVDHDISTHEEQFWAPRQNFVKAAVEALWAAVILIMFTVDVWQFLQEINDRRGFTWLHALRVFSTSHAGGSAVQVAALVVYHRILVQQSDFFIHGAYDVYEDNYSPANFLLINRLTEAGGTHRWAWEEDVVGVRGLASALADMDGVSALQSLYRALQALALLAMLLRLVFMVRWQQRLAMVTSILGTAWVPIGHLLATLGGLIAAYSVAAHVLHGYRCEDLSTVEGACSVLALATLSGSLQLCDAAAGGGIGASQLDAFVTALLVVSYTAVVILVGMSLFLAILLDDYFGDEERLANIRSAPDFHTQILALLRNRGCQLMRIRGWPRDELVLRVLRQSLRRVRGPRRTGSVQWSAHREGWAHRSRLLRTMSKLWSSATALGLPGGPRAAVVWAGGVQLTPEALRGLLDALDPVGTEEEEEEEEQGGEVGVEGAMGQQERGIWRRRRKGKREAELLAEVVRMQMPCSSDKMAYRVVQCLAENRMAESQAEKRGPVPPRKGDGGRAKGRLGEIQALVKDMQGRLAEAQASMRRHSEVGAKL